MTSKQVCVIQLIDFNGSIIDIILTLRTRWHRVKSSHEYHFFQFKYMINMLAFCVVAVVEIFLAAGQLLHTAGAIGCSL